MKDSSEEINLKRKLIEATDAVRKKYKALKYRHSENKTNLEEFHEPVINNLKSIYEAVSKKPNPVFVPQSFSTPITVKKSTTEEGKDATLGKSALETMIRETDFPPSPESLEVMHELYATPRPEPGVVKARQLSLPSGEKEQNLAADYIKKLKRNNAEFDLTFGVYLDKHGKYWIGDTRVSFSPAEIMLWRGSDVIGKYPATEELLDLIFLKNPRALSNFDNVSDETKNNYAEILLKTNAIRKNFNPELEFKRGRSRKYKEIIKPLLVKKGGSTSVYGLPNEKTYRKNKDIEYVYWNNISELIERLKLLWSSRMAGHNDHDNEIIAIIEELREEGIIY